MNNKVFKKKKKRVENNRGAQILYFMKAGMTKSSLKKILIPCKKNILWSSTDTLSTAISL